jgi:O-antigen biosynthesis protein
MEQEQSVVEVTPDMVEPTYPPPGVYGWNGGSGGTHFHRIVEPLRVVGEQGWPTSWGNRLGQLEADMFDTIIGYQLTQEAASERWHQLAARGRNRLVFDIDDAMWSPDWAPFQRYYTAEVLERMYANARVAHVITTPSPIIAEHMAAYNPNVWLVPYTVPAYTLDLPVIKHRARNILGFAGSASHETDMVHRQGDLLTFLADHPDWDLHFWGKQPHEVAGWPKGRVHTYPWTDLRESYYRSLRMDICIAPLEDTLFNRCKSAIRFIENSALGICSIIQDLPPYHGYLRHGENGYFVGPQGFPDWRTAMREVAADPYGRLRVASQARLDAASWTTEARINDWAQAWASV